MTATLEDCGAVGRICLTNIEFFMHTILPIAGVLLALISAACIAYIAWEITKESQSDDS